jgi:hypothetical protein
MLTTFWLKTEEKIKLLALKMEIICSSETLVSTYKYTPCYYLEDQHQTKIINLLSLCLSKQIKPVCCPVNRSNYLPPTQFTGH